MKATKKPCAECPFRKKSIPGYLGPWPGPSELLDQAFSEAGFICHKTIVRVDENHSFIFKGEKFRQCAGALICANKTSKIHRDPEMQKEQLRLGTPSDIMNGFEFLDRHDKRLSAAKRRKQ